MKNQEAIANYLTAKPRIEKVYIHKETGEYHISKPQVPVKATEKQANGKEKIVTKYVDDKNYYEVSREEILGGSESGKEVSPYAKKSLKECIEICVEREYPKEEYEGKKVGEIRSYLESKDAEKAE